MGMCFAFLALARARFPSQVTVPTAARNKTSTCRGSATSAQLNNPSDVKVFSRLLYIVDAVHVHSTLCPALIVRHPYALSWQANKRVRVVDKGNGTEAFFAIARLMSGYLPPLP